MEDVKFKIGFNKATYADVRDLIQPGDVIAFGGTDFGSRWIQVCSKANVNQVATVLKRHRSGESKQYDLELIESVYYRNGGIGVRTIIASELINNYEGKVWWLPLGKLERAKLEINLELFHQCMLRQKGKDYDFKSAMKSVFDQFDDVGRTRAEEDISKFFCAELVAFGLEKCGVLQTLNASEVTPIDLCRFSIFADYYMLIHDSDEADKMDEKISGFNTIDEKGWGMR